ncbi:MAG: hypothetical protein KA385_00970 [Vicinamibacteria bacterium]|nr:hypothetical protein [Vicinamibacteria bacterium]
MHPRLKYYPHHADYVTHANEFRPFVTTMGEAGYRSSSLNTDELGFRVQHYSTGEAIEFATLRDRLPECNLMLGGSTAFGVTASADTRTTAGYLGGLGLPCLNWGVRGATGQQELMLYLTLRYLLPPQRNIVLLSGMNDVSLATLEGALAHPYFGGVFGGDLYFRQFQDSLAASQYDVIERTRLREILDGLWVKSGAFRRIARAFLRRSVAAPAETSRLNPEEQFRVVASHVANTIQTWGLLQTASGARIHYVLQPAIGWCQKRLGPIEAECFEADRSAIASVRAFTDHRLYLRFREHVARACDMSGVRFYDANDWLTAELGPVEVFTDSCHFNDAGYELLAGLLRDKIAWH